MSYDPKRIYVAGRTVYELTEISVHSRTEQANRWSMTVQSARQAHEADDATMEKIAATTADLLKNHTARLAALDAEIEALAQRKASCEVEHLHHAAERCELKLAGLRRAREIIAGKGKP